MDRRVFLKTGLIGGALWVLDGSSGWLPYLSALDKNPILPGTPIWDAHAHPNSFYGDNFDRTTPTISMLKESGVAVCVFAAVGDYVFSDPQRRRGNSPKIDTERQLERLKTWSRAGEIKIIKTALDLDLLRPEELGAIVAIEGGDALEGRLENLDYFYEEYSVRLITLMHETPNAIGLSQRVKETEKGLTPFGQNLVERMNRLGMIIDVAHAQRVTLKDITALTSKPVVDSHTGLALKQNPFSRLRSSEEMEWVAKTGGMIGTWPLAAGQKKTLRDWAEEICAMKSRLGMAHIGLGTDGGGRLPKTVEGYANIKDLHKLATTLTEVGLGQEDLRAFLGGNLERVVRAILKN